MKSITKCFGDGIHPIFKLKDLPKTQRTTGKVEVFWTEDGPPLKMTGYFFVGSAREIRFADPPFGEFEIKEEVENED